MTSKTFPELSRRAWLAYDAESLGGGRGEACLAPADSFRPELFGQGRAVADVVDEDQAAAAGRRTGAI
ncbi:MAG TPA: hypothetical protein PLU87_15370, partial [Sedimentisphaerales bacterium]|nr:hypothetical protein [Sedimentisphaerales bacterium]HRS12489.1 hypothetical protein [Sedimentisphaerales bacterium]HRV49127.1 hypothetical protein [Sedimentisphaerales bacterium]